MRHVISAAPDVDIGPLVDRIAGLAPIDRDPTPAILEHYGFQSLHEVPQALQKRLRLEAIDRHIAALEASQHAICDHSVFLFLADWMRWSWAATPASEWERVLDHARPAVELSETIHHVVSGPLAAWQGSRAPDRDYGRQVERLMRALYRDLDCEARVKYVSF